FCEKLGVECLVYSVDIPTLAKEMGIGEEECGRIKRYECFNAACCDAVATAHSLSDSIETMMFNLIRGTGTKGLCGIPAKRGNIIRPLIECTRKEIEDYCEENSIAYVTDSTNLSDDYSRNYIRHNIIPAFSKINESFENAISDTLETLRTENEYLESQKDALLRRARTADGYNICDFIFCESALRRRALADILSSYMSKDVEKRHIDLLDEAVISGQGKIEISKDLYIVVGGGIMCAKGEDKQCEKWLCKSENGTFDTPYGRYIIEKSSAGYKDKNSFDADKLQGELIMSSRRDGDRFYDKKRSNTKTLKKLFNEKKIPSAVRNSIAVLRDGENILWIEGIGTDGKYLPDINSKNVLIIKKEG
ncbi:MAG: tRNA lysidine(34) synthetase TilS, partial [Clostridia bacterium]|nr:tRNA lysidine(34) synthetase TilS [Clostridia bacterium]